MSGVVSSLLSCCCFFPSGGGGRHYRGSVYYYSSQPVNSSTHYYHGPCRMGRRGKPLSLQTVELRVRMCCSGCERVVRHAISKLTGVDAVEIDVEMEKVTVTGYVDRGEVLKAVRRSGKRAEYWPNPGLPLHFTTPKDYFRDDDAYRSSYNYYRHGYNGDLHGRLPEPPRGSDPIGNLFNDDDVHACLIM